MKTPQPYWHNKTLTEKDEVNENKSKWKPCTVIKCVWVMIQGNIKNLQQNIIILNSVLFWVSLYSFKRDVHPLCLNCCVFVLFVFSSKNTGQLYGESVRSLWGPRRPLSILELLSVVFFPSEWDYESSRQYLKHL